MDWELIPYEGRRDNGGGHIDTFSDNADLETLLYCGICREFVDIFGSHCPDNGHSHTFYDTGASDFGTQQLVDTPDLICTTTGSSQTGQDLSFGSLADTQPFSQSSATEFHACGKEESQRGSSISTRELTQFGVMYCEVLAKHCEAENRHPTDEEMQAIARLAKTETSTIVRWLKHRLGDLDTWDCAQGTQDLCGTSTSQPILQSDEPNSARSAQVREELRKYIEVRNSSPCEPNRQPRSRHGQYECPFRCGYSTKKGDSLCRHLLTTYPQEFWCCSVCTDIQMFHRHDKFQEHLSNVHRDAIAHADLCKRVGPHSALCARSQVEYQAPFPKTCPFVENARSCPATFDSWQEFKTHLLKHFRGKIPGGPWELRYWPEGPLEDDDDENGWRGHDDQASLNDQIHTLTSKRNASATHNSPSRCSGTHVTRNSYLRCGLVEQSNAGCMLYTGDATSNSERNEANECSNVSFVPPSDMLVQNEENAAEAFKLYPTTKAPSLATRTNGSLVRNLSSQSLKVSERRLHNQISVDLSYQSGLLRERYCIGRVFQVLWSNPLATNEPHNAKRNSHELWHINHGFSEARRFIVIANTGKYCVALPISSYNASGDARRGVESDHRIVYLDKTTRRPAKPLSERVQTSDIKIVTNGPPKHEKLRSGSRIHYGKVYTIEHNVRAKDVGMVDEATIARLKYQFREVHKWRIPRDDRHESHQVTKTLLPSVARAIKTSMRNLSREYALFLESWQANFNVKRLGDTFVVDITLSKHVKPKPEKSLIKQSSGEDVVQRWLHTMHGERAVGR